VKLGKLPRRGTKAQPPPSPDLQGSRTANASAEVGVRMLAARDRRMVLPTAERTAV